MKNKQKTNLFRFATVRPPQIITKEREDLGFLKHPNPDGNSWFNSALIDSEAKAQAFIDLANPLPPSTSPSFDPDSSVELKTDYKDLWKFSQWLGKQNGKLSRAVIDDHLLTIPPLSILDNDGNNDVWDNFYYQVILGKNHNLRELCHQIITASNFIEKYETYLITAPAEETEEEKELRLLSENKALNRLANLKLVLYGGLSTTKQQINNPSSSTTVPDNADIISKHKSIVSEIEIDQLKTIKADLQALEQNHIVDYSVALESAAEENAVNVNTAISAFQTANPELFAESKKLASSQESTSTAESGNSAESTKTFEAHNNNSLDNIPSHVIPSPNFEFDQPLSDTYRAAKGTALVQRFIEDSNLANQSIENAFSAIESKINEKKNKRQNVGYKVPSEVMINGVVSSVTKSTDIACVASFVKKITEVDGEIVEKQTTYITIETDMPNAYLKDIRAFLYIGTTYGFTSHNSNTVRDYDCQIISNEDGQLTVEVFGETAELAIETLESNANYNLRGTFELPNGADYTFNIPGNTANDYATGIATIVPNLPDAVDLHYGVNKVGIVDYRRVEQELFSYVPGEVSHIENIMAREYKERSQRKLFKSEDTFSTESESESEKETEVTANRTESFSEEVASVIDEENSTDFGINASVGGEALGGKVNFSVGSNLDISKSTSISNSNNSAREFASDITERALEKMKQKTSVKRKSKIIEEVESKINQGFDNREGTDNVTGVYRWIDKVYKNRIINYGKKLLYEFMIPEPSRFYKEAVIIKATQNNEGSYGSSDHNVLVKPLHPKEHGIKNAFHISRENYTKIGALYGVDLEAPKDKYITISKTVSESFEDQEKVNSANYNDLRLPLEYKCTYIRSRIDYIHINSSTTLGSMFLKVANLENNKPLTAGTGIGNFWITGTPGGHPEGELGIAVSCEYVRGFTLFVEGKCMWKHEKFEDWRNNTFEKVLASYEQKLEAYNAEVRRLEAAEKAAADEFNLNTPKDKILTHNSKFNEEIVKTELKRLCIELLIAPFDFQQGKDFYGEGSEGVPNINVSEDLDFYSSSVKFFEQAFDWDLLAKKFYPYYWAKRSDWKALFQSQNAMDQMFKAFLQSGMARVMVPVREGFEDAVAYFMQTGEIWNGSGIAIDSNDKLYLSLVDEATERTGTVEGLDWETVVPTSLTILQNRSVIIDEGGLPLAINSPDSNLIESTTILGDTSS